MSRLTGRQARFVSEYLIDINATQAAIRAGYSKRTAASIGHELLGKPAVQAALSEAQAKRAERTGITQDRVIEELRRIALSDPRKLFDGTGNLLPIAALSDEAAASIASIEIVTQSAGKDADGNPVAERVHKIRAWDKVAALTQLGRHLGLFRGKEDDGPGITIVINGTDARL